DHDERENEEDGVQGPGLAELVDPEPPTEPEEGLEVLPVHGDAASSQVRAGAATASAPANWMNRFSSESPLRISAIAACSTSARLPITPTCVTSFSTISKTCDVRKTVDPRAT